MITTVVNKSVVNHPLGRYGMGRAYIKMGFGVIGCKDRNGLVSLHGKFWYSATESSGSITI